MRPKGINRFEQHVEKIVFGVVAAIFLVVLITQLTSQPLKLQIGGVEDEPVDLLEGEIVSEARRAQERMGRTERELAAGPEGLPPVEGQRFALTSEWDRIAAQRAGEPTAIAAFVDPEGPGARPLRPGETPEIGPDLVLYPQIEVPAPSTVLAASFRSTIDPYVVITNPDLTELLPEQQPFDKPAATVEAVLNGQALAESLATDPDGQAPEYARPPSDWWEDNIAVFRVEVQRCEGFDESGEPINPVLLSRPPGRESPLEPLGPDAEPSPSAYQQRIDLARSEAERIVQPAYYRTIAGPTWRPPSDLAELERIEANRNEIDRVLRRFERASEEVERLEQEIASVQPGGSTAVEQRAAERRRERLEGELEQAIDRRDRQERELESLGVNTEGEALILDEDSDRQRERQRRRRLADLLETDEYRMWFHDVTVEPGKRYHYRVRAVTNNPYFGYTRELSSEQAELARQRSVVGAWSSWSDAVDITPDETFFVTSASLGGAGAVREPRTSVQAFRFYYGYWRSTTISLAAGETIRGEIELPDPNLLPIYDLEALEQAGDQGSRRPRSRRDEERTGARLDDGEEIELPPNASPGPATIPIAIDAMLLDVGEVVGAMGLRGGSRFQAYLQAPRGRISVRRPDEETASPIYGRLVESAEQGTRQGLPEPEPEPEPELPPERAQERREPELPPSQRGRGGGAGGG